MWSQLLLLLLTFHITWMLLNNISYDTFYSLDKQAKIERGQQWKRLPVQRENGKAE